MKGEGGMALLASDSKNCVPVKRLRRLLVGLLGDEYKGIDGLIEVQLREYLGYALSGGDFSHPVVKSVYEWKMKDVLSRASEFHALNPIVLDRFLGNITLQGVLAYKKYQSKGEEASLQEALESEFIQGLLEFYGGNFAFVILLLRRFVALVMTGDDDHRNLMQVGLYGMDSSSRLIVVANMLHEDYPAEFRLCFYPEVVWEVTWPIRAKDCHIIYDGKW